MANTTPPDDDRLIWDCPHCNSLLELDDTGELFVLKPPALRVGEHKGVNGITVIESDPGWKERDQKFNMGEKKRAPQKVPFGFEHTLGPKAEPDPAIEAAAKKDLKKRNINLNDPND